MKRLLIAACLALGGCATFGVSTPAQGLYAAYGGYEAAQHTFADYADGPNPSPKVVHAVRVAKDAPAAKTAIAFGKAFVACRGSNTATVPGIDCAAFNFTTPNINQSAIALRSLIATLQRR